MKVKVPSCFVDSSMGEMMIDQLIEDIVASGTHDDDYRTPRMKFLMLITS